MSARRGRVYFFISAKRTNQAEGCYQNFRLRDKLNYGGNSGIGGHTAENCGGGRKKSRETERLKMVPVVNPSLQRRNLSSCEEVRARPAGRREGGALYPDFSTITRHGDTKRQLLRRIFIDGRCHPRRRRLRWSSSPPRWLVVVVVVVVPVVEPAIVVVCAHDDDVSRNRYEFTMFFYCADLAKLS